MGPSVWYMFTPTETRFIQANTSDSDYFAGFEVYSGAPDSLSFFTCADCSSRVHRQRWHDVLLRILGGGDLVFSVLDLGPRSAST